MRRHSPKFRLRPHWWVLLATSPFLAASYCETTGPAFDPGPLMAIHFIGEPFVLVPGQSRQLGVEGVTSNQYFVQVADVQWSSLDTSIAVVSSRGVVRAKKVGDVLIRATASGRSGLRRVPVRKRFCGERSTEGTVRSGSQVSGTIGVNDCGLDGGMTGDAWALDLAAPTTILAELVVGAHDFSVAITDLDRRPISRDTTWEAIRYDISLRQARSLPAGHYLVQVSEWAGPTAESYTLRVFAAPRCGLTTAAAVPLGTSIATALDDSDCVLPNGLRAEGWLVAGPGIIAVSMTSTEFIPRPLLTTAELTAVEPAFHGRLSSTEASFLYRLTGANHYFWATPVDTGAQLGSYSLKVHKPAVCNWVAATQLALGVAHADSMTLDDCIVDEGYRAYPADLYTFEISTLGIFEVEQTVAEDIPWYATPGIAAFAANGIALGGTFSRGGPRVWRIEGVFVPGTYGVRVWGYNPMAPYSLVVRAVP